MTDDVIETRLVPLAAELVGCVRDEGPDAVAEILARVPDGRHDALAVVLAAMVDPDQRPSQLLAWTRLGPVSSRDREHREERSRGKSRNARRFPREHGTERGYRQHVARKDMPACKKCMEAHRAREAGRYVNRKSTGKATVEPVGKAS